ncbi:MAG TPA: aromatic amino acid transport family protein [bacterium]|nr:aromatic amino acid transport family protein [bacterium]
MKNINWTFWQAVGTMTGSIIGAGILGLPYALSQNGVLNGLVILVLVGLGIMTLHLLVGEIVLSTARSHQLTGFANKYLGSAGKWIMFQVFMAASYGSLLAYLVGGGQVLSAIFGGAPRTWSLIFFVFASVLLYIGLRIIKKIGFVILGAILVVVLLIAIACLNHWELSNLATYDFSWGTFYAYGVVLYAFLGASAIYQARKVLEGQEYLMRKAIMVSNLIPMFLYILFAVVVIGVTGLNTTQVATVGLGALVGPEINILGNVFAFLALSTSFLTLANAVKETYFYDFDFAANVKVDRFISWSLTISVPLFLFLLAQNDFIQILNFVGAVAGGLEGLLLLLIYYKLKQQKPERPPEYKLKNYRLWLPILFLMMSAGLIYNLIV